MSLFLDRRPHRLFPKLNLETLEQRCVPAGVVQFTGYTLLDGYGTAQSAPVMGQQIQVQATWQTTGVSAGQSYIVRIAQDGVPLDTSTFTTQAGSNISGNAILGGWFALPGSHSLTITVDPNHTISGADESQAFGSFSLTPTQPTTLPHKFITPIAGIDGKDWAIVNYMDVDPRPGIQTDYRGGPFVYDGHNGADIGIANFARMDAGVNVLAAAAGTVSQVQDGNFDRNTVAAGQPANYVVIDHGGGWNSIYFHFKENSIKVKVGDTVTAGQVLGQVGSSGNSTGPHLHFAATYQGMLVETFSDPTDYFVTPIPYQADQPTGILDAGVTNATPVPDITEHPVEVDRFPTTTDSVWFWYDHSGFASGEVANIKWYRPDNSLVTTFTYTAPSDAQPGYHYWYLSTNWGATPGIWHVAVEVNGTELVRKSFEITTGATDSAIRLTDGSTYIIDGRTTPIEFGSVPSPPPAAQQTFNVENRGFNSLTLSNLILPTGLTLVGSFPTTIAPSSNANFTVKYDPTLVGDFQGSIQFQTNDPHHPSFHFAIQTTDTVAPSSPSSPDLISADDTGSSNTDNVTTVNQPTFTGTAEPNSTVQLFVDGVGNTSIQANAAGTWTAKLNTPLKNGTYSITARAKDKAGNVSLFSSPMAPGLVITGVLSIDGDADFANENDALRIAINATDSTKLDIFVNSGSSTTTVALSSVKSIIVNGLGGNDNLIIDNSHGNPLASIPGGLAYDGGAGSDTLTGPNNSSTWTLTGPNAGKLNTSSSFTHVEILKGGSGNDLYAFDTDSALGNESVSDAGGIDTLTFGATTTKAVAVNLGVATAQAVNSNLTLTLGSTSSIENVVGTSFNDTLTGNSRNNILNGGAGNDTYVFDTDTALGNDSISESTGTDTLTFAGTTTKAVAVNLGVATAQVINSNLTLTLGSASTMEYVVGGTLNDTLTGNSRNNILNGQAGNDTYVFDTDSALGNDTISESGVGIDTLTFAGTTTKSVAVNLGIATAQVINSNLTLTLGSASTIENVLGGSLNDTLTGNSLNNILVGNDGNDTLTAGTGRALLIGGLGADTLKGGSNDDILVGGATSFDANVAALNLLMAEWSSSDNYTARVNYLKGPTGRANGSTFLNSSTVSDDSGAVDSLTGNAGTDWFLYSVADSLKDKQSDETATTI